MDAARVFGDGEPILLTSGKTVTVTYGMRSLAQLERDFGGIANIATAISPDGTGAVIVPTMQLLAAGLLHEHDENGAPFTIDRLFDELDVTRLQSYVQIAGRALALAFPTAAAQTPAPVLAAANDLLDSLSPTGSTSPSSSSDVLSTSGSA